MSILSDKILRLSIGRRGERLSWIRGPRGRDVTRMIKAL